MKIGLKCFILINAMIVFLLMCNFAFAQEDFQIQNNTDSNLNQLTIKNDENIDIKLNISNQNTLSNYSEHKIIDDDETVTYENKVFQGYSDNYGGAILVQNGKLILHNCTFKNNHANYGGGAIWIVQGSSAIIENCIFTDNIATSGNGGAILIHDGVDSVIIKNCKFISNKASNGNGGAIAVYGNNVQISNSLFQSNQATSTSSLTFGGAIYWCGLNGHISNTKFISNHVKSHGGAISVSYKSSNLVIEKSTFLNNRALINDGGALSWGAHGGVIKNCVFQNNHAKEEGGAIDGYSSKSSGSLDISNSKFISNNAKKSGGAIFTGQTTFKINKCTFSNNNANTGAAIYNQGKTTITSTKFKSNTGKWGGAIYSVKTLSISKNTFYKNHATLTGGAVYVFAGNCKSTNNKFISNKANVHAGAVYTSGSAVSRGDVFYKNKASHSSGAVFVQKSSSFNVRGSYFIKNSAKYYKEICNYGKTSANNNWWGNTIKNKGSALASSKFKRVKVQKWLVLKISASKSKVTVDLRHNNANKKIRGQGTGIPVSFKVKNCKASSVHLNAGKAISKITKKSKKAKITAVVYSIKTPAVRV